MVTKSNYNYRELKKALSKYFTFGFKTPHYTKDFTPQQKAAITRKYHKIFPYIDGNFKPLIDEVTFLKYPKGKKLAGVDGVRTDTGLFYKWPRAKLTRDKIKKNKYVIEVAPKPIRGATQMFGRKDYFYPFPKSIINNLDLIKSFVDKLTEKYNPHDIMWGTTNLRERQAYLPETFDLYFSAYFGVQEQEQEQVNEYIDIDNSTDEQILADENYQKLEKIEQVQVWRTKKMRTKHKKTPTYYNGVFLIYYFKL